MPTEVNQHAFLPSREAEESSVGKVLIAEAWQSEFGSPASTDKAGHRVCLLIPVPGTWGQESWGLLARQSGLVCELHVQGRSLSQGRWRATEEDSSTNLQPPDAHRHTYTCVYTHKHMYTRRTEDSLSQ